MSFEEVIEQIAKQNNTTAEEVLREMQYAIDEAWSSPNKTEAERKAQADIPCQGEKPTVEEFIEYIKNRALKEEKKHRKIPSSEGIFMLLPGYLRKS